MTKNITHYHRSSKIYTMESFGKFGFPLLIWLLEVLLLALNFPYHLKICKFWLSKHKGREQRFKHIGDNFDRPSFEHRRKLPYDDLKKTV